MVKRLTILTLTALIFFSASLRAEYRPGLTITEQDGWPSGTPAKLKFSNGTVTDNFDGSFSITNSGGGGGGGTWGSITGTLSDQTDLQTALNAKEPTITAGTTSQYWRGDKSWQTLDKTAVGLGNVDNTSDLNKPVSTAQQTALDLKVDENAAITGATKTKITYDAKGLVTAGADATTADISDSTNRRYVTDAQQTVISNTSGTNSGDVTLAGTPNYITISGQTITRALIDLAAHVTGLLPTGNIANNAVTDAQIRQSAGLSVIGRSANTTGNVADITAANDGEVLRRSGTSIGFGTVVAAGIANSAVTNAKLANMAANTVKVNATTGSAAPADLALSASTILGRGSTGNIVGLTAGSNISIGASSISATPAGSNTQVQFNNAGAFAGSGSLTINGATLTVGSASTVGRLFLSDSGVTKADLNSGGLSLYSSSGANFTAISVNSSLATNTTFNLPPTNGSSGQFLSTDGAGNTSWASPSAPSANSITDSMLRQSAGLSVIGRSANTTGNVADITAANDGEVLRRSGTSIGFGTVVAAGIANSAVTNAKLANMAANTVKVNATTGSAAPADLALSASTILGRGSTGNIAAITAGANISFDGTNLIGINSTRTDTGATVTVASTDRVIIWNGSAAGTANLPDATASTSQNIVITIHNITTAYDITIDPNLTQTIRGQTTLVLTPVSSISFVSDGSNWVVVSEPVSAFRTYTPTLGSGFGTTSEGLFAWRRIGDSMQIKGSFRCGTTGAGSTATITIPTGYSVDTAKVVGSTNGLVGVASRAINGAAANSSPLNVAYSGSNLYIASRSGGANITADTVSTVFSSSDRVAFDVTIPITSW